MRGHRPQAWPGIAGVLVALLAGAGVIVAAPLAAPAGAQTIQIRYIHTALASCPDCDDDGVVTVDELVTHVSIALDATPLAACAVADTDGDSVIAVHEIVGAVHAALDGCWLDEILVADSNGSEHLEVVRSGDLLRFIVTDGSGREIDLTIRIADWEPGRAYEITATWHDGTAALYVDGSVVGRNTNPGPLEIPSGTPFGG